MADKKQNRVRQDRRGVLSAQWFGYAVTATVEILLTIALLVLGPHLPLAKFPVLHIITIGVIGYLFGEGPSVLAFALSSFFFDFLFIQTGGAIWPMDKNSEGMAALISFLVGSIAMGFMGIGARRSKERVRGLGEDLAVVNAELEERIIQYVLSQEELRASEARFTLTFHEAVIGIAILDCEGKITNTNPSLCEMLGSSREALCGKPFSGLVRPNHAVGFRQNCQSLLRGECDAFRMEVRLSSKGSDGLWGRLSVSVVRGSLGSPRFMTAMVEDVTELKKAEQLERKLERHKLEFHRRTILAATEGKLEITEAEIIRRLAGPPVAVWKLRSAEDTSRIRHEAAKITRSVGMDDAGEYDFLLSLGEAMTNAYKHASGGTVSVHRSDSRLLAVVSDDGPGIEAIHLPDVALLPGYSTAGTLGMGYRTMLNLVDKVYLATGHRGTTIALEMKIHASENHR